MGNPYKEMFFKVKPSKILAQWGSPHGGEKQHDFLKIRTERKEDGDEEQEQVCR